MTNENFNPEDCLSRLNALLAETTSGESGVSLQCSTDEDILVHRAQTDVINVIKETFGKFWDDNSLSQKLALKETGEKCLHEDTKRTSKHGIKIENLVFDAYAERKHLLKKDVEETSEQINILESTLLDYKKCLASSLSQIPR